MIRILQGTEWGTGLGETWERGGWGEGRVGRGEGEGRGTGKGMVRTPWFAYALTRTIEGAGACAYVCVRGYVCGCVWRRWNLLCMCARMNWGPGR